LHIEIFFLILIFTFFIFFILKKEKNDLDIFIFALFIIVSVFYLLLAFFLKMDYTLVIKCLDGNFCVNKFIILIKMFILLVFSIFIIISFFVKDKSFPFFEFILLTFFSILGSFLLIMANNLMFVYLGLELQSLVLYILPIMPLFLNNRTSEASFKYFIFGTIASSLILLGISFIYGFCGTLNFFQLLVFFDFDKILDIEFRFLVGVLFVILGVLLKIGVVPFHF
jgi:NADH-quinone oxidoreductase subunit N